MNNYRKVNTQIREVDLKFMKHSFSDKVGKILGKLKVSYKLTCSFYYSVNYVE